MQKRLAIIDIDVTGAPGGVEFELSGNVGTGDLTLTNKSNGHTQILNVKAMADGDKQTLNFDNFGVKIELGSAAAGQTVAGIVEGLVGSDDYDTMNIIATDANGSATFAIGANKGQNITVAFNSMSTADLGRANTLKDLINDAGGNGLIASTSAKAQDLIVSIDNAITKVSTERSKFGAVQNRLEHTINNLSTSSENLTAAESRIRDVDMAKEIMEQTKNSILSQAAQAMLAQANQAPQGVLQLLR